MNQVILAIDGASKITGWAIFKNGTLATSGTFCAPKNSPIDERIFYMYKKIREKIVSEKVNVLVFEDCVLSGTQNVDLLKWLARLHGMLMVAKFEFGIEYEMLYPSEWRKLVGIHAKKREDAKNAAIDFCNQEFDKNFTPYSKQAKNNDDDEAEAILAGLAYLIRHSERKEHENR